MIFLFGRNLSAFDPANSIRNCHSAGDQFWYTLRDTERKFENQRYLILLDTTIDRSCEPVVNEDFERMIACYESKSDPGNLFAGNYFIALYDKQTEQLNLFRDISGVMTGYYTNVNDCLIGGNEMHAVARLAEVTSFDELALFQLLYTMYFVDGRTFYEQVNEVKCGGRLRFDSNGQLISEVYEPLKLATDENGLAESENIALLRERMTATVQKHAGQNNVVMLSGGIDSVVLLLSLDELRPDCQLTAVSYLASGTRENETIYAKDIATHLKTELTIKEIDPNDSSMYKRFEATVLKMNNPYYGVWIFGQLPALNVWRKWLRSSYRRIS